MTLSVLMSVHNGEKYVREAIESILAQTYRDFEFVIVDDGSTDETNHILNTLAEKDSRVVVIKNKTNIRLTASLNKALRQAQGILIARMDADDVALPDRFRKQVAFLNAHPDIGVVGTAFEWIDEHGSVIEKRDVLTSHTDIHRALIRTNPFLHGSVMMRKELLDQVHSYNETYKKAQDYDLWLRLSSICRFANLPDVLMQKRMTRQMISFKNERTQIRFAVRARYEALKRDDYPLWCAIYLLKPFLATLFPLKFVRWIRVHVFQQKIYAHASLK